jgi:GAF domain-containing protein
MHAGGQLLGALCVYGDRAEDSQDSLIGLLAGLAAHIGQYLERRRAEELAVELARTKDEFVALVTHELRNPLAVIAATAALAEDDLDTLSIRSTATYAPHPRQTLRRQYSHPMVGTGTVALPDGSR